VSVYAGTKVTTYSLHPGSIRTELTRHVSIITDYALGRALYYVLSWPLVKEPWNGAQTSICCAVDPALATESGKYYRSEITGAKGKGSPYSTAERRVPELIPVLGSQKACR